MGFWNWIVDLFSDEEPDPPQPSARAGNSAVATLDRAEGTAATDRTGRPRPAERWWMPDGVIQADPLPMLPPSMSTEARALENLMVSHFDGHDLNLPAMPRVAERVLSRLRDPKSSMAKVAKDIAEDQVTAGDVLRMANSALYRGLTKITSLQAAVTRLGANALKTLMMHETMRAAMFYKKGVKEELADMLWRRSLASGCVMRGLAQFTAKDRDDAFLLGLLHDVGNVLVVRLMHEQRKVVKFEPDSDTFEYLAFECHQEFGELIANGWGLPESLTELIANHHKPPAADDPLATERWMLIFTDMTNQMLGYDVPNEYNLLGSRAATELAVADRPGFEAFLAELPEQIEDVIGSFRGA
jgi:HD-like signal output (HDOD) protein